jgi:predicted nuclease with TOPRIM domain
MTDKQIIFKCDVDCIRKNTEECFELDCIKGQESILKQLKAKEQECEELKGDLWSKEESLKDYIEHFNKASDELDQLKVENKELERKVESYKCSTNCYKYEQAEKYRQTLTEIKEIAENAYCLTNGTNKDMAQFAKQILQKISECEGNDG